MTSTMQPSSLCSYGIKGCDQDSKHTLIAKGSIVSKQQKFSKTNRKAMKVALEQSLKGGSFGGPRCYQ